MLLYEDFESFFEHTRCGYVITDPAGTIMRTNRIFTGWVEYESVELEGKRISDLFTVGGRIYSETHLWPLLQMQQFFDEVSLVLSCRSGATLPVLLNATLHPLPDGKTAYVQFTFFKATDRLRYEKDLRDAKTLAEGDLSDEKHLSGIREQFIAVLGHDLRNPLSAINMAVALMEDAALDAIHREKMIAMIKKSSIRMKVLIENIMDFARTRLGGGMYADIQTIDIESTLAHVTEELKTINPQRKIIAEFYTLRMIRGDGHKIGQLYSNLLANAITYGDPGSDIVVRAATEHGFFELSVCNSGPPIPPEMLSSIFRPFTRESTRPSQQGLGLGLYIASEIARVHNGSLTAHSDEISTCFIFRMPVSK